MLKRNQIIVIASVVLLMGILLSLDIKGLVKPADQHNASGTAAPPTSAGSAITVEGISASAKKSLDPNLVQQITSLETALKSASAGQKLELQKQLARKWEDVNQPAPGAFYYEAIAETENTYSDWLKAGDLFTNGYQITEDTLIQEGMTQKAIYAYQKALALNPMSLEAQTGLGIAYVSGTSNPMQGIQLLLAVVKKDPENIKANMNLGLFSMKSGQFDKAVNRFRTVVTKKPSAEAWFYLASSYESLGNKGEAISAYEKSKGLAGDPGLTKFVDDKVQELRKN
jgi:tetratricopeptide (TPR) repeat protein